MSFGNDFEIRKELGSLGRKPGSGRILTNLIIQPREWYVEMYAFYPNDLRFKSPIVRLREKELSELSGFLGSLLSNINKHKGTIPENRLFENEIFISTIYINYMVRRNKVDIRFYFKFRSGIGVILEEDEIEELLVMLSGVSQKANNIMSSLQ